MYRPLLSIVRKTNRQNKRAKRTDTEQVKRVNLVDCSYYKYCKYISGFVVFLFIIKRILETAHRTRWSSLSMQLETLNLIYGLRRQKGHVWNWVSKPICVTECAFFVTQYGVSRFLERTFETLKFVWPIIALPTVWVIIKNTYTYDQSTFKN